MVEHLAVAGGDGDDGLPVRVLVTGDDGDSSVQGGERGEVVHVVLHFFCRFMLATFLIRGEEGLITQHLRGNNSNERQGGKDLTYRPPFFSCDVCSSRTWP